jgi:hypothetical protein
MHGFVKIPKLVKPSNKATIHGTTYYKGTYWVVFNTNSFNMTHAVERLDVEQRTINMKVATRE